MCVDGWVKFEYGEGRWSNSVVVVGFAKVETGVVSSQLPDLGPRKYKHSMDRGWI